MKKKQSLKGRTASRKKCAQKPPDQKRRGALGELEAFCGRESDAERSEAEDGSPQPKLRRMRGVESRAEMLSLPNASRAQRGTSTQSGRRYTKRRGELGEAAFLHKASAMGFGVAKPWGDSDRYDLIVNVAGRLLKVQVKSAHRVCAQAGGGYHFRAHPHQRIPYRADEIDFLVAYIVPEDIWYVFPPSAFKKMKSMRLFPYRGKKRSKFEQYRDAWHLFQEVK